VDGIREVVVVVCNKVAVEGQVEVMQWW
jgi:hypothetical protein